MLAFRIFFVLIAYTLTCASIGALVIRLLEGTTRQKTIHSVVAMLMTSVLIGQGFLANLWVLIALTGWFSPGVVIGVLIVCFIAGLPLLMGYLRGLARWIGNFLHDLMMDRWEWKIIGLLVGYLSLGGITSLGSYLQGDAVNFYMTLPKVIAASHRLSLLPGKAVYYPLGLQGEMHYAALMSLGLEDAVRLFTWITALAGALMLCALGAQVGIGRRGQWILLGMVFSSTAVLWVMQGKTDLFSMSLGIAAYYWAIQKSPLRLPLTGLFIGLTLIAKTSYLITLIPGIALIEIWHHRQGFDLKKDLKGILVPKLVSLTKSLLILAFWIFLVSLPHLIKNSILLGNPFSYIYNNNPIGWFPELEGHYSPRVYLTYLFEVTFGDYRLYDQLGDISPMILAFLPLALLLPRQPSWWDNRLFILTLSAFVGVTLYIFAFPGYIMPRYILATLFIFGLPAARAIEYILQIDKPPYLLTIGGILCILITLSSTILSATVSGYRLPTYYPQKTWRYLTTGINECELGGPSCQVSAILNQQSAPGSRVLSNDYETYWMRADLQQCTNNQRFSSYFSSKSGAATEVLWKEIYEEGFSYLIIDKNMWRGNLESPPPPDWVSPVPIARVDYMEIYRLDYFNPPFTPLWQCSQVQPPAWEIFRRQNEN